MRNIKFRGRRLDNGKWVYGSLVCSDDGCCMIIQSHKHSWFEFPVDPNSVGQFTSLYDKNHDEIYEGDILAAQDIDEKLEVRFVRGVFAFLWNGNLDNEFLTGSPTREWAKVVGNIHENPELIKGDKQ